ncbi:MAG: hypothetical protein H7A39_00740 [Chlamydiales bacterium]|nr:hypothetical protein [Chlamydiales bacterium]
MDLTRRQRKFFPLERAVIAGWQGASEDQKFAAKPTQSNMNLFFINDINCYDNDMAPKGIKLASLEKKDGKVFYRGKYWTVNEPIPSTAKGKKMMVLASKTVDGEKRVKIVHFGALGYGHNYSAAAKKNYLARSAGIRNKDGKLTKNDPWSANYWARKILWPVNKPAVGPRTTPRKRKA